MTANTDPIFAITPNVGQGVLSVANTNRDGTGTLVTCFTAGANGSRIDKIIVRAAGSTSAGMVRLYLKLAGGSARLLEELQVLALTATASVQGWGVVLDVEGGLNIPPLAIIAAAPQNAEGFVVTIAGGDF